MMELQGTEGLQQYFNDTLAILDAAIVVAGEGLTGDVANRVHVDGQATDGGKIGAGYSTKPFFALTRNFAKRGYPGALVSSTGISVRLPNGYKDFREFSGRQTGFVDLKYSGHLQTSYRFVKDGKGAYAVGFIGAQSADFQGVTAKEKAGYLENLYGKEIFTPTTKEIDNFFGDIAFEWRNRST